MVFYILTASMLTVGIYLLFAVCFKAPSAKQATALYRTGRLLKTKHFSEKMKISLGAWLAKMPFFPALTKKIQPILDQDKKQRTAEVYLAGCFLKTVLLCSVGLIGSFFVKPFILIALAAPFVAYFEEYQNLENVVRIRKETIEKELPDFIAAILVELSAQRDLIRMMTNYLPYAGSELKKELSTTILDMQSGNYEQALLRMEYRVCSSHMSSVIRGLIGVTRGNDETTYFQLLAQAIRQSELTRQKRKALELKPKFTIGAAVLLVICFMLIFGVLLIDLSMKSGDLFG